jgi:hypothetical protein
MRLESMICLGMFGSGVGMRIQRIEGRGFGGNAGVVGLIKRVSAR